MDSALLHGRRAALLFFKRQCPPCVVLSRLAVVLSLGAVRRVPLDAAQARDFYAQHPALEGMPVLVHGGRVAAGPAVFLALPRVVAARAWQRLRALGGARDRRGPTGP